MERAKKCKLLDALFLSSHVPATVLEEIADALDMDGEYAAGRQTGPFNSKPVLLEAFSMTVGAHISVSWWSVGWVVTFERGQVWNIRRPSEAEVDAYSGK